MSKIKNTTANKKKRIENGNRAESFGSNPHSKALFLLRDNTCLNPRIIITDNKTNAKTIAVIIWLIVIIITVELKSFLNCFKVKP